MRFGRFALRSDRRRVAAVAPPPDPGGDTSFQPNGYGYRRDLFLAAQNEAQTIANLVALVHLTLPELKTTANGGRVQNSGGWDIRFEIPGGTKLDHRIEKYDGATGELIAWVRIPSWNTGNRYQFFLYYGKSGLTGSEENPTGVWTGYLAVWDARTGTDWTSGARNLTAANVAAGSLIGDAGSYDGASSDLRITDATFLDGHAAIYVQAFVQADATIVGATEKHALMQGDPSKNVADRGLVLQHGNPGWFGDAINVWRFALRTTDGSTQIEGPANSQRSTAMVIGAGWESGQPCRMFIDGAEQAATWTGTNKGGTVTQGDVSIGTTNMASGQPFSIGVGGLDATKAWKGLIDLVTVRTSMPSALELRLEADLWLRQRHVLAWSEERVPATTNIAPLVWDQDATVAEGGTVDVDVLAAAYDPEGATMTLSAVGPASNGTTSIVGGKARYQPNAGFSGSDSFQVTVSDGSLTGTATVHVTVTGTPLSWPIRSGSSYGIGLLHDINRVSEYETWLGVESDVFAAFTNDAYMDTWDDIAGGAGGDVTTFAGQIGSGSYQFWTSRTAWPANKPWIISSLGIVPKSHSNEWNGSSWGRPGIWGEISNGNYDIYYQRLFARLANMIQLDGRDPELVAINMAHEMTGNWYPWSIGTDVSGFKTAWQRIVGIARDEFAKVGNGKSPLFIWRPSPVRRFGSTWNTLNLWDAYPGDAYVDVVGLSVHDKTGISSTSDWNAYLNTGTAPDNQEGFKTFFDWAVANTASGIKLCVPEWSFNKTDNLPYFPATTDPTAAFNGFRDWLALYGSRVLFAVYMNSSSTTKIVPSSTWSQPYKNNWGA